MSLQGRLRFNPKNYVRTVFFGLHGDDNNSGLNEDKLKRNFYGAVAAANLIVLGAGERGCIIGLGAGEFDHEDTANNGDLTVPDNWDVFMPHQILNIAVGTGGAGASKLVTNRNAIMAYGIKMNDGADWAIEDANANVEVRLQTLQAAAAASGKLHVKTTATNCQLSFEAASLTAVDKLMLLESDTGSFDIEFNTLSTGGPVLTITNPLFDIVGMDGTLRPFKMTTSGSSGTITGVKTSGDAKVCVISNAFMGFDVDYETAGTSEMGVITCTDNGNNIQGAGSILVLNHQMTYVRTIFVNKNGLDTNDGTNPERAVATIPRALQIAAGIVLGADEVGVIKVTDASNYEHSSAAYGDGAEEIPLLWKLDMGDAGLIGFSGGSGNVLTLKNYAGLDVRFLDLRGGFNIEIIDAFSSNRLNVQNFNCSDNTYGKLHVKPTATNCDIYINIKNPEVGTGGILLEPASGHINLVTGTFDVSDTSTTYNLIEVKDCNVSYSFGDIRMTPGAGTITGLRAKGTAEVCIIGNDNQADIDFATEDTATISGFVCMDRGTASEAGGAITLLTPSGLGAGGVVTTAQSTNYSAVAGDFVLMTTGATDRTVTFPASPTKDDVIVVKKIDAAGTGKVILDGNGKNIDTAATQDILSFPTTYACQYDGTEWWIK